MNTSINSAIAFTFINDDENEVSNLITDYAAQEKFTEDMWKTTVQLADGCYTEEAWVTKYEAGEQRNVERRERENGEVIKRTKAGKIVADKAFPKAWNASKAVISKALRHGKPLFDDEGNPLSKHDVMASYKEAAADERAANHNEKSAFEKIQTVLNAYAALYPEMSEEEKETVRTTVAAIHMAAS